MNRDNNGASTLIENEKALLSLIDKKLIQKAEREISIVCAGHFILMYDKERERLIPAIFENSQEEYYKNAQSAIGIFPQYTWKLGCIIIKQIERRGKLGKLALLVNDWQLVPVDKERKQSQPNKYREAFYKDFKELPPIYKREFELHHLALENNIYRTKQDNFYLREVGLKDRFLRKIKNILLREDNVPVGMCTLNINECGNIVLNRENKPSHELTVNSNAKCAGGVSQMMIDISNRLKKDYDRINFINLMPKSCTEPVNVASEFAIEVLKKEATQTAIDIVNIYFESYGTAQEDDFYETYGQSVFCYQFNS
jgi:hypothetical protein